MYRQQVNPRERTLSIAAVLLVHAGLLLAVLNFAGVDVVPSRETLTELVNVGPEPPPPPEVESPVQSQAAPEQEGAASPKNIKSEATPVSAPKPPPLVVPTPNPITASPTPREGSDATQGESDVVGPGTGAGGTGTGTGAGGSGNGPGGGGSGQGSRPTLATRGLSMGDFPPQVLQRWPRRGAVFTIVRVQADGRPSECKIGRSSGDRTVDDWVCSLIISNVRFNPARDGNGRPVADYYGYVQEFRSR